VFTGIVRAVNSVKEIEPMNDGRRFLLDYKSDDFKDYDLELGSSVCVSGVCLTVAKFESDGIWMEASGETLEKTTLSGLNVGDLVNLEPSLRVGDEIGGHFVFGHVDTTVTVESINKTGDFYDLSVRLPSKYRPYVTKKGSVALDGISLTVNRIESDEMAIRIIPHTFDNTRIKVLEPGMEMNLEVDMLARYVYTSVQHSGDDKPFPPDVPPE
jgi:riboflavin synthase